MNLEQLEAGNRLASEIHYAKRYEEILSDEELLIQIDRNRHYGFEEESIELLPEEKEALKSIREAYRTVLLTANNRKLEKLRTAFKKL